MRSYSRRVGGPFDPTQGGRRAPLQGAVGGEETAECGECGDRGDGDGQRFGLREPILQPDDEQADFSVVHFDVARGFLGIFTREGGVVPLAWQGGGRRSGTMLRTPMDDDGADEAEKQNDYTERVEGGPVPG